MRRGALLITAAACAVVIAVAAAVLFSGGGRTPAAGGDRTSAAGPSRAHYGSINERGDVYRYATYVPPSWDKGAAAPLVVVLHGCGMTPAQMEAASTYDSLAQANGFIVLYPDVDQEDANSGHCWKGLWGPELEGRGRGDAGAIAAMTNAVAARYDIDRSRIYAIGISAGGFEASVLGAYYPDLYAAIGIHSGAAFGAGHPGCEGSSQSSATGILASNALAAMGTHARSMPVIVVHGDADPLIPYRCAQQAVAQWLRTDNLIRAREGRPPLSTEPTSVQRGLVRGGLPYTLTTYPDPAGCVTAQLLTVHGMGHYWSGGFRAPSSARYSDPRGPSATAASWAFFSRWRTGGPRRPCSGR